MSKRLFSPLKKKDLWNTEDFSIKLLETEIELEKGYKLEVIEDLITLYSHAIEHYNEEGDPKYYDYQDRLHKLLITPEVAQILNGHKSSNTYNFSKRKSLCNQLYIKNKLLESAKNSFKLHAYHENISKETIIDNVAQQETRLENRISSRRSRKLTITEIEEVSTKISFCDEKEQMEEIMEKYISQKAKRIEEITLRYMLTMESATNSEKNKLAQEMNKEIINVSKYFDEQRIEELHKLKELKKEYK